MKVDSAFAHRVMVSMGPVLGLIGLAAALQAFPPLAFAHSIEDVEKMLSDDEIYLQVVHQAAPDFSLRDAEGKPVGLKGFRGEVVVLYFIFASCPDECPLQSEKLAAIQKGVNGTPMRDRVQFIAITTDPEHDTEETLRAYAGIHGLDPANWIFLTSGDDQPAATRELARRYGLEFTPTEDGTLMHGIVTHLIDKSGNLRARYHGLKFDNTNMILFINALTNDTH